MQLQRSLLVPVKASFKAIACQKLGQEKGSWTTNCLSPFKLRLLKAYLIILRSTSVQSTLAKNDSMYFGRSAGL